MGHKYTKNDILAGALDTVLTHGLSRLTYGRVAQHLGTSDRVVAYYFPTTGDLAREVLTAVGAELQATLASCVSVPVPDHIELLAAVWSTLADDRVDPIFALFFEASGLAMADREPYATLVPQLVEAWISWATTLIEGRGDHPRTEAETAIAVIDGLLLLRQLGGRAAADRAARRLGVAP